MSALFNWFVISAYIEVPRPLASAQLAKDELREAPSTKDTTISNIYVQRDLDRHGTANQFTRATRATRRYERLQRRISVSAKN